MYSFLSLFVSLALGIPTPEQAALYGQCAGQEYKGPTSCAVGTCEFQNQYYSQCLVDEGEHIGPSASSISKPDPNKRVIIVHDANEQVKSALWYVMLLSISSIETE